MNRKDLFACPFFIDKIELDDRVYTAIKNTPCKGAMSYDENVLTSNFDFLHEPVNNLVSDVMSQLGFPNYHIFTSWMTYTTMGYRHGLDHMHCNSFMSGVLYLTDNASPILFRHPNPWRWSSGVDDTNDGVLKSNQYIMSPFRGDIVIFPSHVHHMILPHHDEEPRCSIAFNVVPVGKYGARDSTIHTSVHPN